MQFRLSTLLLAFVVFAAAMGLFGGWGIPLAVALLGVVAAFRRSKVFWSYTLGMPLAIILALLFVIVSAIFTTAIEHGRYSSGCSFRLERIGWALKSYQQANGSYPPAYLTDKNGRPVHSWRVLLLPYLEPTLAPGGFRGELSEKLAANVYKFDQPWNAPGNRNVLGRFSILYECRKNLTAVESELTSFAAVVGPNTAWPGERAGTLEGVQDEPPESQILLVEVANSGIHWLEPRDLSLAEALRGVNPGSIPGISSNHILPGNFFFHDAPLGAQALFADGTVRVLLPNLPREALEALLTVGAGSERKAKALREFDEWKPERRIHWPNCCGLAVLLISVGIMLFRRGDTEGKVEQTSLHSEDARQVADT